jgi:hypothetical protein
MVLALGTWLRALNAVGTVAEATKYFRGSAAPAERSPASPEPAEPLEARLASVLVAALGEAFDRDRARFDLERGLHEAEAARKEAAIRLEWIRRTGSSGVAHARNLALLSVGVWVVSVAAAGWLAPLALSAKVALGLGWVGLSAAIAAAFVTHQQLSGWLAQGTPSVSSDAATSKSVASPDIPVFPAQKALPWLFLLGFLTTALSLIIAL